MNRVAAVAALALTLGALAVGCGGSSSSKGSGSSAQSGDSKAPVTLKVWVGWSARELSVFKGVVADYHKLHPNVTVDVTGGNATFTLQFAPGTLDLQSTIAVIQLYTDQNAATGITAVGPLGIDYNIDLITRTNQLVVSQATPATCASAGQCYSQIGSLSLFAAGSTLTASVPLTMLGNASGRMNVRMFAYNFPQQTTPTVVADYMPDTTLAPAHVP